jgi:hypothetical protein
MPQISESSSWRIDGQGLIYKPSGHSIYIVPLNHPKNRGDDLFLWISAAKPGGRILIPVDGMRLRVQGQEYAAKGWACPPRGEPVRPRGDKPMIYFDSEQFCGLVQFHVQPPESTDRFSLVIDYLTIDGHPVPVPEIQFVPGKLHFRGGFN